jgi:S1-C subfamily serine protease
VGAIPGTAAVVRELVGTNIRAVGRTSGLQTGRIESVEVDGIKIHLGPGRVVIFSGLIETTPFSQPGDSGAPVLTEDGRLLGFVYAASPEVTLVMPILPVLDALGVAWDPAG